MRVSQLEMEKSHQKITKGASRLMRKRGIEATSVNDVMKKAGLTHGGFYRHFSSKEALVSASLEDAFGEVVSALEESFQLGGKKNGAEDYYKNYLSEGHFKHPELGCPIAALSADVARSSASIKDAYSRGFQRAIDKLSEAGNGTPEENRLTAIRKISMLAGAMMIARASDSMTASEVLRACKLVTDPESRTRRKAGSE